MYSAALWCLMITLNWFSFRLTFQYNCISTKHVGPVHCNTQQGAWYFLHSQCGVCGLCNKFIDRVKNNRAEGLTFIKIETCKDLKAPSLSLYYLYKSVCFAGGQGFSGSQRSAWSASCSTQTELQIQLVQPYSNSLQTFDNRNRDVC